MDIRLKLRELVRLQDQITHLNERGHYDTAEFNWLKGRRDKLMDEITLHVDELHDAVGNNVSERWER